MSFLLDTNVISELRKGPRCDPHVKSWFQSVDDADLFLSVLVIGELRVGIERIRRRDPQGATALENWLTTLVADFGQRILSVDYAVADQWGRMNAAAPLSTIDSLLAATAKIHGLILVTRNVKDVQNTGAQILNPFTA